uniref:Uncharacterized protein n=1 Tax=Romanomermis culicivorax TaxID=13658 RepID=A0A915K333_ROMCU
MCSEIRMVTAAVTVAVKSAQNSAKLIEMPQDLWSIHGKNTVDNLTLKDLKVGATISWWLNRKIIRYNATVAERWWLKRHIPPAEKYFITNDEFYLSDFGVTNLSKATRSD